MPRHGHGPGGPHGGFQKPKNTGKTIGTLMGYIGRSKWLLLVVALCLVLNTACSIGGMYMLRPLIDECIVPATMPVWQGRWYLWPASTLLRRC